MEDGGSRRTGRLPRLLMAGRIPLHTHEFFYREGAVAILMSIRGAARNKGQLA
jgi:hypothetical protein